MADIKNITEERASRRFHQVVVLERQMSIKGDEIVRCKAHFKELENEFDGLLARLLTAARDEGPLPLFNLDE